MRFKTLGVASSLAIVTSLSAPAYAQDTPAQTEATAEDEDGRTNVITVTAQFREQNLQDTPIAITAVNSEMLEARGQTNIAEVAAQAPNVSLTPQPQNGGTGLIAYIRGVGQTDFNYALDPGVGIYIDDVFIPTLSSSLLELMDLDRIEILRGPQGTLAGKNSIGGAIKLFSAEPRGDGTGSLMVTYGSFDRVEVRGMADFAVNDQLAVRISGLAKGRDGYVDLLDYGVSHPNGNVRANNARGAYPVTGTQGGQGIIAGRIALKWEPTDTVEFNISGDYTRERSEPQPTVLLAAGLPQSATNPVYTPNTVANGPFAGLRQGAGPGQPAWLLGKDGTAMYVGLLSMFALQAFGTPLTPAVYGLVLLTGALAAFGTAPVPSASLFMLAAVLSAVGIAPEQTALVVGFVLPFDRLLDMTRTVPSASANLTVATTVARWEGELDEALYRARPEA